MKMISGLFFAFIIFLGYVFLATSAEERMGRACEPILWVGHVTESIMMLAYDPWADSARSGFEKVDYGCRFTVWRFFYEKKYVKENKNTNVNG